MALLLDGRAPCENLLLFTLGVAAWPTVARFLELQNLLILSLEWFLVFLPGFVSIFCLMSGLGGLHALTIFLSGTCTVFGYFFSPSLTVRDTFCMLLNVYLPRVLTFFFI